MPTRWMVASGDVRRSLMERFPYVILFRIVADDTIRLTVVKHERRHPTFAAFQEIGKWGQSKRINYKFLFC